MKRIMSVILAITMVISCAICPSFVSGAYTNTTIDVDNVTAAPGDTVTININHYNFESTVGILQYVINFPNIFESLTVEASDTVNAITDENFGIVAENGYDFVFKNMSSNADTTVYDMSGVAFTFTGVLKADAAEGTYPLDIYNTDIADYDFNTIDTDFVSGSITVASGSSSTPSYTDTTIEIESFSVKPGETVSFDINHYNFESTIGILQYVVNFPNIFDSLTVESSDTVNAITDENFGIVAENGYDFVFKNMSSNADTTVYDMSGVAFTFTGTIKSDATPGTYALEIYNTDIADYDFNTIETDFVNGVITVEGEVPATKYAVTVNSGTANVAEAAEGDTVTITAADPATGMVFSGWTVVSGGVTLADATAATTTFTMGTEAVEVTANYEAMAVDVYVTNGSYTGTAAYGETITITAAEAPVGQTFDKWVVTSGSVTLADETASTTTFTMGTEGVAVKATYKDVDYTVSVDSAITGGTVSADVTTANYNDTVTVTVTPDSGKKIANLYYTVEGDTTENAINTTLKSFTMPAGNVTIHATFEDVTGIIISGDYRGEAGDEIYTGDTNVTVDLTVSENTGSFAGIVFTLDIEDGLTTGTPTFDISSYLADCGMSIAWSEGNTYFVVAEYATGDVTAESFVLGTVTIPTVTAASSSTTSQYAVSLTVDQYMVSDGNADAVDVDIEAGTVYVSKTIQSITFYDKTNNYSEWESITVDETVEDKDGYVADYINNNIVYKITYTDGTTDSEYTDATSDMFADLTTDVTDDMKGGSQATITGSYTQTATGETVSDDVVVNIALNETIVAVEVTPDTLYFKVGDTFAWGETAYTLTQANDGTVGPNTVTAGIAAGTITADTTGLDNTNTAAQTITVVYADDTTITDTVTVYFVAPTIESASSTQVYYEEGVTYDLSKNNVSIVVSYNEAVTGIANETITSGIEVAVAPSMTLATDEIAAAQDVVISYNGSADYTIEDAVVVVDFTEFAKVLVGSLTANDTVTELLKLSNYGTTLVTTDYIAVRNIAVRK